MRDRLPTRSKSFNDYASLRKQMQRNRQGSLAGNVVSPRAVRARPKGSVLPRSPQANTKRAFPPSRKRPPSSSSSMVRYLALSFILHAESTSSLFSFFSLFPVYLLLG